VPQSMTQLRLRLARASRHFSEMQDLVQSVKADVNSDFVLESSDDKLSVYAKYNGNLADITDELGIVFGDCVHNSRSVLDNLAFSLASIDGDPPYPSRVCYPICETERAFAEASKSMAGMRDDAIAYIRTTQPFILNTVEPKPVGVNFLTMLHDLSNIDKHRLPHLAIMTSAGQQHNFSVSIDLKNSNFPFDPATDTRIILGDGILQKGSVLYKFESKLPIQSASGHVLIEVNPIINYAGQDFNIINLARNITVVTADILDCFVGMVPD
jgi:hypothetical protein